jgi:hypothetical protein
MSNPSPKFDSQDFLDETNQLLGAKIDSLRSEFAKLSELAGIYPVPNFAVEVCCATYSSALKQAIATGSSSSKAHEIGRLTYRAHMPRLSGPDNIRDFVACVAHGMCTGVIPGAEGTRLLYAAQVAYSSLPSPKRRKKRHKTPQMHTERSNSNPNASTT